MGFWSTAAGIALGGVGVATGNPALIGMGASIATGGMAADASRRAAETQSQAADRALANQQQVYDTSRGAATEAYNRSNAVLAPWVTTGSSAMGSLGGLLGLPPASSGVTDALSPLASPQGAIPTPAGVGVGLDAGGAPVNPRSPAAAEAPARAAMSTQSGYAAPRSKTLGALAGGLVTLQAPDGTMQAVPAGQAEFYVSKGARVVENTPASPAEVR